ncbi:hypothetical protein ACJMK2_035330 [Sinanodonta woodiana]|uniref:sphinganine-1-phosphate aldolase n=1 Tax=Sinanodonta woodiana TaxID=1069815 RepID=A0ABD3WUK8_SINWO
MEDVVKVVRPYIDLILPYLEEVRVAVNNVCSNLEPWQIILITVVFTLIVSWVYDFLFNQEESLVQRFKKAFFKYVKRLPIIKGRIDKEMIKYAKELELGYNKGIGPSGYLLHLPKKGLTADDIRRELQNYHSMVHTDWSKGSVSGAVYSGDPDLTRVLTETYGTFAWTNPLHPDLFPDVRKMEAEIVRMCCSLFHGGPETCGTMTSGGTESILLACLGYRNRAREKGIKFPEIIVPVTVHAAFDKAASIFHMKITHIKIDPKTMMVDVKAMRRAINKNTCLLVGSAPHFPHGIIDPMEEIGKLGLKYDIPVHTDCCLGGFLIPFMEKAGFSIPPVDFRIPGITSISADTHKYGFAPKGSSVIMYLNRNYRKYQWFIQTDWPGGVYASPTLAGSRAGAIIAACWAAMMYMGEDGYVESTKKIISTTRYIVQELRKIPGIEVLGEPLMSLVAISSTSFNIFRLSDALSERKWMLNPLQFPSSVHLCVTLLHTKQGVADRFIKEVREITAELMKDKDAKCDGMGAIYGMAQRIPDRSLVHEIVSLFLDASYNTNVGEPVKNGVNGINK